MIVWDTAYLSKFFEILKSYIGSATNIGILALAGILGLWLLIRVVKHFTKG